MMRVENEVERQLIAANEQLSSIEDVVRVQPTAHYLNVSFNTISSLNGLEQMTELRCLDVSHNEIESLQEIEGLQKLLVLKCSSNRISDLSWITKLHKLEELWVRENCVERAQLAHLQQLTELQTLVIHPNPCTEQSDYILVTLKILPWLQRIDTVLITEELREEARHADVREALDSGATDCSLFSLSDRLDDTPRTAEAPPGVVAATSVMPPPSSTRPAKSKQQIAAEAFMRLFPVQDFIPVVVDGANVIAPDSQLTGFQEEASTQLESRDTLNTATIPCVRPNNSLGNMDIGILAPDLHASGSISAGESDGTSALLASVLTLPAFDGGSFLQKKKTPQLRQFGSGKAKLRAKSNSSSALNEVTEHVKPFHQDEEFVVMYPNSTVTAIQVRRDGSAIARWPTGSVAVSVDFETSAAHPGFRVYAAHKDGQLALSFDPAGVGFVNAYPSGKALISTTSSGDGLLFDSSSSVIVRQWDCQGKVRDESGQHVGALGNESDGSLLCRLSEHLAVRVQVVKRSQPHQLENVSIASTTKIITSPPILLHIYFAATPNVRHVFANRANHAEPSSDECDAVLGKLAPKGNITKCIKTNPPPVEHLDLLSSIRAAVAGL